VKGAFGLRVVPDGTLDNAVDLLTVPGGGHIGRTPQGVRAQIAEGKLTRKVAELNRQDAIMGGVCTGAMILSAAGVLDGRAAITHHASVADRPETSAKVVQTRVVDDGDIVTFGGLTRRSIWRYRLSTLFGR
jgi:transcriptional regulator GlxA family with amidase domain